MKKTIVFFLSLTISTLIFAQTFEGKVIYKNSCKSKMPNVTDEQFTDMLGNTQEFYIKSGNYKSVTNGTLLQWQVYSYADNRVVTKMSNAETAFWNDGAVNTDEVQKVEVNKNVTEVLGYKCDELILTCKSGIQKYYYNAKFSVDPLDYKNHKYGNWYDVISRTKAFPLKFIIENAQFTMESVASEIKPMQLDNAIFKLPANINAVKSPY